MNRRACFAPRAAAKRQRESPDKVAPNSEPTAEAGNVKPLKSKKNMKKTLRTMGLCALAALAVVSCKKNEEKVATTSFQATITQPTSNAKTHIGNDNWLLWNTGDAIKVFDGNGTAATFTTNDNNAKVANFEGEIEASERYCAFYPAASASDASAGTVTLTLAATQTYKNGSFETNTYPMTATNNENNFAFSSPCGLLAIPVKGTGTLGSIELTSKTQNEMLAGTYAFNLADMSNEFTGNATTVTLDCEGGLTLSGSEAATMVFVLPVGTLANGFTAVLKGTNGAELYRLETTNDNAIAADMIRDMPAVTVSGLPVNTTAATNVVYTTATLNGNCTAPVGMSVTEVGFYWGNATAMNNRVTATVGENFSYDLEGLEEGTEYAFQAFAKNGEQEYTGSVETFTTGVLVTVPTVTTSSEVSGITADGATCGGTINNDGNDPTNLTYGICYSTTDGFEGLTGTHVEGSNLDNGSFTVALTGLTANTTYYVRAYATNSAGTTYGEQEDFATGTSVTIPTVTTSSEVSGITADGATCGGTINNDGNDPTNLTYGICYSTTDGFEGSTGTHVEGSNLDNGSFTVALTALTGNTQYYFRAYATNEAGTSYGNIYSFTTLVSAPSGAINGLFSVNTSKQVYFSQGNLQYTKSAGIWSFIEHQYDIVETSGQNVGDNYANQDIVSLFGWGTSGYTHGAAAYQPWTTSPYWGEYKAYGDINKNLYDKTGKADWGYNPISNGGNEEGIWRTLTNDEWYYVFNTRSTISGIRWAKGSVNGMNGVVLLPDDWDASVYTLNGTNSGSSNNNISITDWTNIFEANGAVFLPAAGIRPTSDNTKVYDVGISGNYWSSSHSGTMGNAMELQIGTSNNSFSSSYRYVGISVRLVRDKE